MEKHTKVTSPKTKLNDRTLWFDGDSSFNPNDLLRAMQQYDNVHYVDALSDSVNQFNRHCSKEQKLVIKQDATPLSYAWNLPAEYQSLDVKNYVFDKLILIAKDTSDAEFHLRSLRVIEELQQYEKRTLFDVLRAIIYVINTLIATNTVWGVGRGSSVSSYVLYLIGVHDVDSFEYDLDIEDFLHD